MLEFPAYCPGAGLAGAKWAQAPSGHVSTGLWGENSTDESQFIPTLTDAYGESERAGERKESISHYLTRARNLHNSCASLCIGEMKTQASLTEKQREAWHEGDSRWWENVYLYTWWRKRHPPWQASETNALLKHQVHLSECAHTESLIQQQLSRVPGERVTYYSNVWSDIMNIQKNIMLHLVW